MDEDQATVDEIENKENEIDARHRNCKSGIVKRGIVKTMVAMIIMNEFAQVDALKTVKNDPEFEVWKWFLLNWAAVVITVMLILLVLWRKQTKVKRIIMKNAETQTTISLCEDGCGVRAIPTMKQPVAVENSSVIYLAKYGRKYHCRIDCHGLNAAERAKVVTYEKCLYCT